MAPEDKEKEKENKCEVTATKGTVGYELQTDKFTR